jgi:hypothetical protein
MEIAVVGGGPGGLYFAVLARKLLSYPAKQHLRYLSEVTGGRRRVAIGQ